MAISKVLITKCIIYFTWGDDTAVPYGITARNGMEATKAGGQKHRRIGYQQKMEMREEICVITSSKAMFGKNCAGMSIPPVQVQKNRLCDTHHPGIRLMKRPAVRSIIPSLPLFPERDMDKLVHAPFDSKTP
ncbi:MAG: hypothetical protein WC993_11955 [Methanoculleus sp.]